MHKQTIAAAVLAASFAMPAMAANDGDLWILPVTIGCVAQYPELVGKVLTEALANERKFPEQLEKARACLRKRPWSAKALCTEVLREDLTSKPDPGYYDRMRETYSTELSSIFADDSCLRPKGWAPPAKSDEGTSSAR